MGCYCCGCEDCLDKLQADMKTHVITEKSNSLLSRAKELKIQMDTIVQKSLLSYSVPTWTGGGLSQYHRFITLLKERKNRTGGGVVMGELTAERCEAAVLEAGRYWQAEARDLAAPDAEWQAVVTVFANKSEELTNIRKNLNSLEEDQETHLKNIKQSIAQAEAQGNLKPIGSAEIDQETKTEIQQLKPKVEAFEAFGVDCVKLARAFLVQLPKPDDRADKEPSVPAAAKAPTQT